LDGLYPAALRRPDGALVDFLEQSEAEGLLANTLVVVTADHGEELLDHGALGHGFQLPRRELVHVPLIVRAPGQRAGARIDEPLAQPAIANQLLEMLGTDARMAPDACLAPGVAGSFVTNPTYREHPLDRFVSLAVYSDACMQLDVTPYFETEPVLRDAELFGTEADCERQGPAMRAVASCLRARILDGVATAEGDAPPVAPPDLQLLEQLRALGYVR
jgi:hypothetical protein